MPRVPYTARTTGTGPANDDWNNRTPTYTVMQLLARTGVHQPVTLACKRVKGSLR